MRSPGQAGGNTAAGELHHLINQNRFRALGHQKPSLAASRVWAYSLSMITSNGTDCEENDDGNADSNPDRRGQRRRR